MPRRIIETITTTIGRQWKQRPSSSVSASFFFVGHGKIQHRWISIPSAKKVLGFPPHHRPTVKELRLAYFEAAKRTHPDSVQISSSSSTSGSSGTSTSTSTSTNRNYGGGGEDFCRVTEAYERLLGSKDVVVELSAGEDDEKGGTVSWKNIISREEEEEYRRACQDVLGIPAEIVEESKQNPMFRHWLHGNTDGAQHWRAFFAVHGGLAQKLVQPVAFIESGQDLVSFETRRRRRRR